MSVHISKKLMQGNGGNVYVERRNIFSKKSREIENLTEQATELIVINIGPDCT